MAIAKDARLFIKVTLDFPDNEKILPLSDAAFRALIEMTIWSRKQESDGWLATRLALAKWSLEVLDELSTNHPTAPSLIASETGWQIHDYADHQETKADIEARRERNKLNGQKGGLARGKRGAKRPAKPVASNSPSETQAEIEIEPLSPNGDKGGTPARTKPRKRITDDYMPSPQTVAKLRSDHPRLTDFQLDRLHEDFRLYWQGQGRPMADWDATWLRWMRQEAAKTDAHATGGSRPAASDAAFASTQALKLVVPDDRLEIE